MNVTITPSQQSLSTSAAADHIPDHTTGVQSHSKFAVTITLTTDTSQWRYHYNYLHISWMLQTPHESFTAKYSVQPHALGMTNSHVMDILA